MALSEAVLKNASDSSVHVNPLAPRTQCWKRSRQKAVGKQKISARDRCASLGNVFRKTFTHFHRYHGSSKPTILSRANHEDPSLCCCRPTRPFRCRCRLHPIAFDGLLGAPVVRDPPLVHINKTPHTYKCAEQMCSDYTCYCCFQTPGRVIVCV